MTGRSHLLLAAVLLCACSATGGSNDDDIDEGGPIVPSQAAGTGGSGATGGNGSGLGQGGTGGQPLNCEWPAGPYGEATGDYLSQSKHWQGYRENSTTLETVQVADYFDCDGSRGINAVMFTTVQWYCGACDAEAEELESRAIAWKPLGIRVAAMLLTGSSDDPAVPQDALQWKTNFGLNSITVVADPNFSLVPGNSVGTPQLTVVNPRTMQVFYLREGYSSDYSVLESLAQQNASQ